MDILYIIILLLGLFLIFVGYFSNVIAPILSGVAFILILIIKRYERY